MSWRFFSIVVVFGGVVIFELAGLLAAVADAGEAVGAVGIAVAVVVVGYRAFRFIRSAL